jgi:CDP-diglyceride synthetase
MSAWRDFTREAQERAREAQERLRETQERVLEARERAEELARERTREAQEIARKAAETMPPGLLVRLISSLVGIPLLMLLVFAEAPLALSSLPFVFAVAATTVAGTWEYFRALRMHGYQPIEAPAFLAVILLQFAAWNVSRGDLIALLPVLLALLVIGTLVYAIFSRNVRPLTNVAVTFLGVVYIGWLFSYLIFLRSLSGTVDVWPFHGLQLARGALDFSAQGAWVVLYVLATTWSADAGAYFVGMRYGKRPLAPRLSPKKSVEGAAGGLAASILMSLLWGTWIGIPWYHCLILGAILGPLGEVGDLCESALKRDLGIKDFGGIMPGHGGVLDRFDSVLFTAPVAYYYLSFMVGLGH